MVQTLVNPTIKIAKLMPPPKRCYTVEHRLKHGIPDHVKKDIHWLIDTGKSLGEIASIFLIDNRQLKAEYEAYLGGK